MAKGWYIGNESNIARKVKRMYIGDGNDVARKVKKVYIGDENGKARLAYSSGLGKIIMGCWTGVSTVFMRSDSYNSMSVFYMPSTITAKGWPLVIYGKDRFVTVIPNINGSGSSGEKDGGYSFDGITWEPIDFQNINSNYNFHAKFLGYVNRYYIILSQAGLLSYSMDGINYTTVTIRSDTVFDSVCYAGGYYYISGAGALWGFRCNQLGGTLEYVATGGYMGRACVNDSGTIMVAYRINNGFYMYDFSTNKYVQTSTILTTGGEMYGSAYGNGRFVMINTTFNNRIYYSLDGVQWTMVNLPANGYGVSFDGNNFLVGGLNGAYMYSPDAITWTLVQPITTTSVNAYSIAGN